MAWVKPHYWIRTDDGGLCPVDHAEFSYHRHATSTASQWIALDQQVVNGLLLVVCTYFNGVSCLDFDPLRDEPNAMPLVWHTDTYSRCGRFQSDPPRGVRTATPEAALEAHAEACRKYLGREPEGVKV